MIEDRTAPVQYCATKLFSVSPCLRGDDLTYFNRVTLTSS